MRRYFIAANWKMNKTDLWVRRFISDFLPLINEGGGPEICIAPPFTSLMTLESLIEKTEIHLCAQNMHWEAEGAFTGEISASMLVDIGCTHVILGHSERREHFGETDERVQKKVHAALAAGLVPILCVGEKEFDRDSNRTFTVIEFQVRKGLGKAKISSSKDLIIAYEPVWAIGTGKTASPEQANEVHLFIRGLLDQLYGHELASDIRIIYGGSVSPKNIDPLMSKEEIDGALVGSASLDPQSFARIAQFSVD